MPLLKANQAAATSFHGVADAAERLQKTPKVTVQVGVSPAAGSLSKALAEEIDGQQGEAFIRKLRERTA